ncbi:MAG: lytic murein transglycosylase [Candidatus Cloacimonetes bacterium]|nr:lytic murein transglycosylase [Candidatus Cloacimonadota bacterium]
MKKNIIFILLYFLFFNVFSSEILQKNEKQLLIINKSIYDFFNQNKNTNSLPSFIPDFKYYITINKDKVFLFNDDLQTGFKLINDNKLKTKTIPQYINYKNFKPTDKTLFISLNNLSPESDTITPHTSIQITKYIIQKLFIEYLEAFTPIPAYEYPLLDTNNRVISTYEYNFLLDAYFNLLNNHQDKAIDNLKHFYALRFNRWKKENSFIQSFELSQEKTLGITFFQFYNYFLETQTNYKEDLTENYPLIYLTDRLFSIYNHNLISINNMSQEKAELTGFLLYNIYQLLNWDYNIENSKLDFHQFLGKKLDLTRTEIDSIYDNITSSSNFQYLISKADISKEKYIAKYNKEINNFDFKIVYDQLTIKHCFPYENYFINLANKTIHYPKSSLFNIKTHLFNLQIKNQNFIYEFNPRNKNIQSKLSTDTVLLLDDVIIDYKSIYNHPLSFFKIELISENIRLKAKVSGNIYLENGQYIIKLAQNINFLIEEEYLEKIEELNYKLIQAGVPPNWLADNINNENFKIYYSVSKYFTNMPEHQVKRGERGQDWYMKHFGVTNKINKGTDFKQRYHKELLNAETRHGIHYELIMAIMAIESDYANPRWKGNFYTFPTLISQYLLIPRRQRFATNQLIALYKFSQKTNKDVYHFIGSFAGAAGWGQFIPSSMNSYFIDSDDKFDEIDIFSIEDTIHSISNYLNKHGLSGVNIDDYNAKYSAVYAYNHSDAYVKAVLHIYEELYKLRK